MGRIYGNDEKMLAGTCLRSINVTMKRFIRHSLKIPVRLIKQVVYANFLARQTHKKLFTENVPAINEKCGSKNEKQDFSGLVDDQQRNKKKILCRRCQCVIFDARRVTFLKGKDPKELKEMSVGGMEGKEIEKTDVWWFTTNEYAFDTIGFLTVDDLDALMCGDCEFGPIGWRTSDNKNFWIAAERMNYA